MVYECENPMINPSHYKRGGMEAIDVIEAFTSNLVGIEASDTANIIKYACRWKEKGDPIENLDKIIWYTHHLKSKITEKKEIQFPEMFKQPEPEVKKKTGRKKKKDA